VDHEQLLTFHELRDDDPQDQDLARRLSMWKNPFLGEAFAAGFGTSRHDAFAVDAWLIIDW
jgi:hypothetical protein